MSFFRAIACIITGPLLLLSAPGAPPEIEVMPGGRIERVLDSESMQAFTWDDQGALWVLGFSSGSADRELFGQLDLFRGGAVNDPDFWCMALARSFPTVAAFGASGLRTGII